MTRRSLDFPIHDSSNAAVEFHSASCEDLPLINRIIDKATAGWALPARVRRLSRAALHYTTSDLRSMQVILAAGTGGEAFAVAAWESADAKDTPNDRRAALLHGIYVDASAQGTGIGRQLVDIACASATREGYGAIAVRAWRESEAFFRHLGFKQFEHNEPSDVFPQRLWRAL
jgi:GNAT superfamily N-acetyltransferase